MIQETIGMLPRRVHQGYTIDELQAGAYSDSDSAEDEDEDAGQIDEGTNKSSSRLISKGNVVSEGVSAEEDIEKADDTDVENELWVRAHFENGLPADKVTLCCPGCFIVITYGARSVGNSLWNADRVVNCVSVPSTTGMDLVQCAE